MKQITRVRIAGKKVQLAWKRFVSDDAATTKFSSTDAPLPSFETALQAFVPDLIAVLQVTPGWVKDVVIRSVSIDYKDEKRGLVVSATRKVPMANGPLVIHTPRIVERFDDEGGSVAVVAMFERVDRLIQEALRYECGDRAQAELPETQDALVDPGPIIEEEIVHVGPEVVSETEGEVVEGAFPDLSSASKA